MGTVDERGARLSVDSAGGKGHDFGAVLAGVAIEAGASWRTGIPDPIIAACLLA